SPITVPGPNLNAGGNKSKKIKEIIDIFKQYPDIFPSGYFRFLPATLDKHDKKGTLIYKNGVVLTYTKYKKTVNKYKKYKIKPGDVKLNQLVNKNQGNGRAKKIFLKFMKKHKDSNLLLDVLDSNKRAIKFYKKNGFKKIANTKFGDKLKGIVMLKHTKKNKTRKKKN
nr:GNAT family N-acetyltransferase [Pelagibacterales bacterium]